MSDATVVLVPGLRGHVEDHWQTRLAATLPGARTVPPLGRTEPSLQARVTLLDQIVEDVDGPVVLVAHSAGVLVTVHWAAHVQPRRRWSGRCWRPRRPSPPRCRRSTRRSRELRDARLAADPAPAAAVPEHPRGEHRRPAGQPGAAAGPGERVGQPGALARRRRPPEPGLRVRRVAEAVDLIAELRGAGSPAELAPDAARPGMTIVQSDGAVRAADDAPSSAARPPRSGPPGAGRAGRRRPRARRRDARPPVRARDRRAHLGGRSRAWWPATPACCPPAARQALGTITKRLLRIGIVLLGLLGLLRRDRRAGPRAPSAWSPAPW